MIKICIFQYNILKSVANKSGKRGSKEGKKIRKLEKKKKEIERMEKIQKDKGYRQKKDKETRLLSER